MISIGEFADASLAKQLHALVQAAYTLEAERIACSDFPPLRETLEELRISSDTFLVAQDSCRLIGALSFQCDAESATITRLVVSPAHQRQGIATALLAEFERHIPLNMLLKVSTAQSNTPAVALYEGFGYEVREACDSPEGITLLRLAKSNDRRS